MYREKGRGVAVSSDTHIGGFCGCVAGHSVLHGDRQFVGAKGTGVKAQRGHAQGLGSSCKRLDKAHRARDKSQES